MPQWPLVAAHRTPVVRDGEGPRAFEEDHVAESYLVKNGLNYPPHGDKSKDELRREPGEVVDDLPPQSIPWLLEGGHVEKQPEPRHTRTRKRTSEDE